MVLRMSNEHADPSANTEAFRAFVRAADDVAPAAPSRTPLIVAGVSVAALIVLIVVVALVLAR
jgi:hypothetical protein